MEFSLFEHLEVAKVLKAVIKIQPRRGRGVVKLLAEELRISSPQVSQFISGNKVPTIDQAYQISRFFHWSELETDYFLTLVEYERASFHGAKDHLKRKLAGLRTDSLKVAKAVTNNVELKDQDKARFYSSWIYSAVSLYCSLGEGKTFAEIREAFSENESDVEGVIRFLENVGLIKKVGARYEMGALNTFVPKGSPYLRGHHCNWRIRAVERSSFISDEEIMFTAPMSISKSGLKSVRRQLQDMVKKITDELPEHGDAEEVVCLSLDFFKVPR